MRVVAISDFHGVVPPDVPPCDLLVVAGDVLDGYGTTHSRETSLFGWLERQPAGAIVGVAGNHDRLAIDEPDAVRALPWIYLEDSGCEVDGLKIWGSPWSVEFFGWSFMRPDADLAERWELIPDDTEILVVHGPPYGILDRVSRGVHAGSRTLLERLCGLPRLRLLVTGHIHEAWGQRLVRLRRGQPSFVAVNASVGFSRRGERPAIVVDL